MAHEIIYLAPPCFGEERYWCEDDAPVDCECADGPHSWTRYEPATPKSSEGELLEAAEELVASLSLNDEDGLTEFAEPMVKMRQAIARAKAGKAQS